MFETIEGAVDCEIQPVIRFLNSRKVLPSEIHHQICQVCGDNAMSDGMVGKWVRMFKEGRENMHGEARSGRPSLVNDDLVRKVNERVRDDGRFTISDLSVAFPQISRTLLYDIFNSHLVRRRPHSMRSVYKNLCPATISASVMAEDMWKNSLKNVESDNNKILYETLLHFFLQRNGTYFLNKVRVTRKLTTAVIDLEECEQSGVRVCLCGWRRLFFCRGGRSPRGRPRSAWHVGVKLCYGQDAACNSLVL